MQRRRKSVYATTRGMEVKSYDYTSIVTSLLHITFSDSGVSHKLVDKGIDDESGDRFCKLDEESEEKLEFR